MAKVWKVFALLLVITALVWLITMWRWQSAQVDPSASALALQLGVLPVVLTIALVSAVRLVSRLRHYAAAPVVPKRAAPAAVAARAISAVPDANERIASFAILASAVVVRAGNDWQAAQAQIFEGACKPELDAQLKDDEGIAVFTAAMPELDVAAVQDAVADLVALESALKREEWASFEPGPEMLRALCLLEQSIGALVDPLEAHWAALSAPPVTRAKAGSQQPLAPTVSIRVAIPARWSSQTQHMARAWIEQQLDPVVAAGLKAAGQSRAMAQTARAAVQLHVHSVATAEAFWLLMDQQLLQWQRDREAGLLLVLSADSCLSDGDVAAMASAQELFSGSNQRGRVPGEGAAGLLLASPQWPIPSGVQPAGAYLHRASLMRRDKSADAAGRVTAQTLTKAVADALAGSACDAAAIGSLTCDVDHRGSRVGEVYEAVQELLPHLEPNEHVLRIGAGCGDLGIARLLVCAGLAANQVEQSQAPGLVLGAFSAFERFAVAMTPAAVPVPPPAAVPAQAA